MCDYASGVSLQSKIFIGSKGDSSQLSAHQKVPFSDCRTGHIHDSRVYVQERELIMLPAPSVRISAPDRNMGKRLWDSSLRVDNKAEQSIDFKRRKWEAAIAAKVRAVDKCLRVFVCTCVRMCSVPNI